MKCDTTVVTELSFFTFLLTNVVVTAVLVVSGAMLGPARLQKAAVPRQPDKLQLGEDEVKQLLLLIGGDENGKITKQAWMKFMEAEFVRLDKDKSGDLDAKDLAQSRLRVSHVVPATWARMRRRTRTCASHSTRHTNRWRWWINSREEQHLILHSLSIFTLHRRCDAYHYLR
jgi:hypothetical protein